MTALEALKYYFGYDNFRPLQAEIIESVLSGHDTLALMPTGGGKSLCFQVPTMVLSQQDENKRLCLVITPLIALMKDQVENLNRRGILAHAIYTGMSFDQQRVALDNCLFGPYHFLYISPERLQSKEFQKRLAELPIGLIAVDEAHCISQWGYDFRPAYLQISNIRQLLPHIPVLALTATATPEVVDDIQTQLGFEQPNVFKKSFHRDNLHYVVRRCEDKFYQIKHILSHVAGSAIIYVRNRKRTKEIAEWLIGEGITADYYHAGLNAAERNRKQEEWKNNRTRVMVCTNAFGMGIDKPDVRVVIHHDLPDTLEAYYQEAGRAGRDGKISYAILLYQETDKSKAQKRIADNYPAKDFVEDVYNKTCDFLQIGLGSGLYNSFALHIDQLCQVMHLPILQTYSALHLLDLAGYIHFEEEHETSTRVKINISPEQISTYTLNSEQIALLDRLMRKFPGVFTDLQYLRDDEKHEVLVSLAQRGIITYIPRTVACAVTMVKERESEIYLSPKVYQNRQDRYTMRLKAMIEYAEQDLFCREQVLLSYFGENCAPICEHCDVCIAHKS